MKHMKRVTSFLLAMLLTLGLCVPALALTPTTDKKIVKAGEEVQVTLTTDQAMQNIVTLQAAIYWDGSVFDYKSFAAEKDEQMTVYNGDRTDGSGRTYRTVDYVSNGKGKFAANAEFAVFTFTAKKDIDVSKTTDFVASIIYSKTLDTENNNAQVNNKFVTAEKTLSVTVTPASTEPEGYAVAASTVNSPITVNEDAQVALKISNKVVTTYNAYYMEVSYDTDVLTYKGINTDASVTDNNGILKIADYGKDKTCGTDNIVLTFTGRTTGEAKVTVTSAKVDVKANAAAQNAPAATITTDAATITVGGYQVTLHEAFTGEGTANHGQDYTFNAKDPSKKYDFSGSTMGGSDVTVTDNGNGAYTVKNVTGPLVIKATEKAGKVKINLTNNTNAKISGITDGQEVDPGTALSFTAELEPGKELVVTVNGEVVTGGNRQGAMVYTITADQVTGTELNIVVSYKSSTDTITIIETGDAWSDVTLRGTWDKGGGAIDMSTAGAIYTLKFKPAADKTVDDYVVTINGTTMELKNMRRGEWGVNFVPNEVAVAGKITIDVSYKKTGPTITVDVSEYLNLSGKTMFLITASCTDLAEGKVLAYNGNAMYWSEKYNAYAWLEIAADSLETVKAAATTDKFTVIDATDSNKISIAYNGDVNLTNAADINDAQLVWNMYNAEYKADTDFQTVNRLKYLSADMNGDKTLDTSDAAAIVNMIVGNGN